MKPQMVSAYAAPSTTYTLSYVYNWFIPITVPVACTINAITFTSISTNSVGIQAGVFADSPMSVSIGPSTLIGSMAAATSTSTAGLRQLNVGATISSPQLVWIGLYYASYTTNVGFGGIPTASQLSNLQSDPNPGGIPLTALRSTAAAVNLNSWTSANKCVWASLSVEPMFVLALA